MNGDLDEIQDDDFDDFKRRSDIMECQKIITRLEAELEIGEYFQDIMGSMLLYQDKGNILSLINKALMRIGELEKVLDQDFIIDYGSKFDHYKKNIDEILEAIEYMKEITPILYRNMSEDVSKLNRLRGKE